MTFLIFATSLFPIRLFLKFGTDMALGMTNKILVKSIEKWRHNDVITDFEDSICQRYYSKNVLPWQYKALFSSTILYGGTS